MCREGYRRPRHYSLCMAETGWSFALHSPDAGTMFATTLPEGSWAPLLSILRLSPETIASEVNQNRTQSPLCPDRNWQFGDGIKMRMVY